MKSVDDILDSVDSWIKSKSYRTISMLSHRCRIPNTTLRRILQRESKLNLENALKILNIVDPRIEVSNACMELFGVKVKTNMLKPSDNYVNSVDESIRDFLNNSDCCLILEMADSHEGYCLNELQETLGQSGIEKSVQLIESDILLERDGRLYTVRPLYLSDFDTSMHRLSQFANLIRESGMGRQHFRSQSLKPSAVSEILEILDDAFEKADKVATNKENAGKVPFALASFSGIYNKSRVGEFRK